jgi:hypothetical protein
LSINVRAVEETPDACLDSVCADALRLNLAGDATLTREGKKRATEIEKSANDGDDGKPLEPIRVLNGAADITEESCFHESVPLVFNYRSHFNGVKT